MMSTAPKIDSSLQRDFIELGLYEGQELLVLDLEKCTRCDECVRACADGHQGLTRVIRDGPRFEQFLVAVSCRSCHDPRCLNGCPVDAIHRENFGLEILIDDQRCIGCSVCATNCPFGSIRMVECDDQGHEHELDRNEWARLADRYTTPEAAAESTTKARLRAANCDLCSSLQSPEERKSPDTERVPRCVYACPHDAAHRMTGHAVLECANTHRQRFQQSQSEATLPTGLFGWLSTLLG